MLRYADRSQGGFGGPGSHFPEDPGRFPQEGPPNPTDIPKEPPRPLEGEFLVLKLRAPRALPAPKPKRVVSFTESALLNHWVLRLIFPSNAALQPLENVQRYGSEILSQHLRSAGDWHQITKPIRLPLRVVVVWAIGCTISPLGALFYGAMTAIKIADYHFAKLTDARLGEEKPTHLDEKWLRVEAYANAFFTDLRGFLFLGGASHLFEKQWSSPLEGKALIVKSAALWLIPAIFLGCLGIDYGKMAALLVARREERLQMTKHLSVWNHLGLSDKDGNPLPFGSINYLPK